MVLGRERHKLTMVVVMVDICDNFGAFSLLVIIRPEKVDIPTIDELTIPKVINVHCKLP